jgi:hypothetical protein
MIADVLQRVEVHPETVPEDDDSCHTICSDCYGMDIPWGTPVTTFCGRLELFDNWADADIDECSKCEVAELCPVCGCGCGDCG